MRIGGLIQSATSGLVLAGAVAMAGGCGGGSKGPSATLRSYSAALEEGELREAYNLMSESYRQEVSFGDFKKLIKVHNPEVKDTVHRLSRKPSSVEVRAHFRYGLDEDLVLVREGGEWKVDQNPLLFYSQKTPRDAVRSFLRAYQLQRWEIMLKLIPNSYRERMTVEMVKLQFEGPRKEAITEMMEAIRVNLHQPRINQQRGNQARLGYGEGTEVELVREDGLWKIKSL